MPTNARLAVTLVSSRKSCPACISTTVDNSLSKGDCEHPSNGPAQTQKQRHLAEKQICHLHAG